MLLAGSTAASALSGCAPKPHPPRYALNAPPPPFDEAIRVVRADIAADKADAAVAATSLPRLFEHGKKVEHAVVLFHGFTNSPQQFEELARVYHARGCNVYVPRIPRHGLKDRLTRDLANLTVPELQDCTEQAYHWARGMGTNVSAVGLSLGGTMALWLAKTQEIDLAVAISPFLMPIGFSRFFGNLAMRVLYAIPSMYWWWDPRVKEKCLPDYAYPGFPTHALAELIFFGNAVFDEAPDTKPIGRRCVFVLNANEPAANNGVTRSLLTTWNAQGADYEELVLTRLGPPRHDIIDPTTFPKARELVYPKLEELVLGMA